MLQAEEVLDLERRDHDADAGGEAGGDGIGHELDELAHARRAERRAGAPAIMVASIRPPRPNCAVIGARTTTKAAVGPETCTREPPSAAITAPATIAV